MSIINEISNTTRGAAILKGWLGNGANPVPQEKADLRSLSCLQGNNGAECPHLKAPRWWETAKDSIATAIKEQLEEKSKMKLASPMDVHPRLCGVCGCCMPLKVFVPIEYIATHTPDDKWKQYPAYCWQRIEAENL